MGIMAQRKDFDLQGHRGARGHYPENSIEGFIHAIECGVNTLELDIVFSKDLQIVVSHEPWISCEICLDENGEPIDCNKERELNIFRMTAQEVQAFDCGTKFNHRFPEQKKMKTFKPLLSQVFQKVEQYVQSLKVPEINYNIEIKSLPSWDGIFQPDVSVMCNTLLACLNRFGLAHRTIVQSFDERIIKYLHQKHSPLSFLLEKEFDLEKIIDLLGFWPEIISPRYTLVNEHLISKTDELGIKIIPWTVNDVLIMKKMYDIGCHGLITDYPCYFTR